METKPNNIKENILRKIHDQELSMRPRIYFTLKVAATVLVGLAVLLISISLCNFIFFSIRISGHESLLGFGPRGLLVFLQIFPWELLLIDIALVALLEWLVRQFRWGYKSPVLYLMGGLLVVTIATAFVIDRETGINDNLLGRADRHELPFGGDILEHARHLPPPQSGICKCVITAIDGNKLVLRDTNSTTTITIVLPPNDPLATTSSLQVGDMVFVAGDIDGDIIRAFGIHKLPPAVTPY